MATGALSIDCSRALASGAASGARRPTSNRTGLHSWENKKQRNSFMQTTVNLPDSLYHKSEELAASRGATMEQFIVEALKKEVQGSFGIGSSGAYGDREVKLPIIRSRRPGTLDLSQFDFDDLLA